MAMRMKIKIIFTSSMIFKLAKGLCRGLLSNLLGEAMMNSLWRRAFSVQNAEYDYKSEGLAALIFKATSAKGIFSGKVDKIPTFIRVG